MNRQQYIDQLLSRARLLQSASATRVTTALTAMKKALENPEENNRKLYALIKAAQAGGKGSEAHMQLAALRIETVNNFIWASSNALTFFDEVDLAASDEPWIENTSQFLIDVDYIGQDGRAKKEKAIRYEQNFRVGLNVLSTAEFEYYVFDVYKGDIRTPQLAAIDMAYELTMKVDKILWPYIQSRILPPVPAAGSAFNYSAGAKAGRHFVPHPNVNVKNLPTSNLLVPAGTTTTSVWRKACLDAILQYTASWGSNAFKDGMLKPMTVFLPSSDVMGLLNEIQLFSSAFPNAVVTEILETGFIMNYGGASWTFVGDSTLNPDDGLAYVRMNKTIGTFFTKKAGDKTIIDNSVEMQKENKESVTMTKIIGAALPQSKAVNIVAVNYRTGK